MDLKHLKPSTRLTLKQPPLLPRRLALTLPRHMEGKKVLMAGMRWLIGDGSSICIDTDLWFLVILVIPLSIADIGNEWTWHFTNSGQYSANSGYQTAVELKMNGMLNGRGSGNCNYLSGSDRLQSRNSEWCDAFAATVLWRVWRTQNRIHFEGIVAAPNELTEASHPWSPPSLGYIKISVDGAFLRDFATGGLGLVMRDHGGNFITARAISIHHCSSPLMAEALAVR
ncbi:hypothetical protein Acr_03g0014880 [Actinidia rufa]|uniref:RNase H type-1 domain-containing protein n=1 Tax=Actinidia rufa TaxID=165716 RepID=A0A7J0EDZ2_9ERIC|nr:hypothetical protein Acr_03g0014880 [Actinidia rufa]